MQNRKPSRSRPPKGRVHWTAAERNLILEHAVTIQLERPDLSGLPLLRTAMKTLSPDRRRTIVTLSQAPWFEQGMLDVAASRLESPESPDIATARSVALRQLNAHAAEGVVLLRLIHAVLAKPPDRPLPSPTEISTFETLELN